jgi:hypothetical protein
MNGPAKPIFFYVHGAQAGWRSATGAVQRQIDFARRWPGRQHGSCRARFMVHGSSYPAVSRVDGTGNAGWFGRFGRSGGSDGSDGSDGFWLLGLPGVLVEGG